MTVEILSRGQSGWREYRRTGGLQRYARDRWWVKEEGQWRKKARHRKDLPSLTEAEYEQWKAKRAAARAVARKRDARGLSGVRQVVLSQFGGVGSVGPDIELTGDRHAPDHSDS